MTADPPTEPALVAPGGKVDPDAVRAAYEQARERGEEGFLVRVSFTISRAALRTRLDKYLTSRVPFMSRSQLQSLIEGAGATVNGRPAKASTRLRVGDEIGLVIPPPPSGEIEPDEIPLTILHEDEHIVVVNKQADIIVHPARSENRGTMINALVAHFRSAGSGELSSVGEDVARPGVVHRLDRNTTGCIVFAKTDEAHWKLGRLFEHRAVDKRYLALTHGWIKDDERTIDLPIGPHRSRAKGAREKQVVRHDALGKPSVTISRVRERYAWPAAGSADARLRYCLTELELKTGRTHQIRVHLSHTGSPIVGDDMYGGRPFVDERGGTLLATPALHAGLLALEHPITGAHMVFTAPVPDAMRRVIETLRAGGEVNPARVRGTVPLARFGIG